MGIYDRDYYRDHGGAWTWGRWGVTIWLIVVTCAVFLAQLITRDLQVAGVTEFGIYDPALIRRGEVWRLLTAAFLHDERNLLHLAFNMLALYWFGRRLEDRYGSREFLLFYLVGAVLANVAYLLVQVAGLTGMHRALGASGAVTAVLVLFACHYPRERVLLMFVLPMPVWLLVVIFVGLDVLGAMNGGRAVAYHVHLAGALFAFVYYRARWQLSALLPGRAGRARRPPQLRVLPAPPEEEMDTPQPVAAAVEKPPRQAEEPFEAKVDRVLEKVSQHGQESLTSEEREILFRASEIYKKRRK